VNQIPRTTRRGTPRPRHLGFGIAAAAISVVALASPAFAHVDAEATGVTADGATEVALGFHHGCGDEPTIEMKVQLPEGFSDAAPGPVEGFTGAVDGDTIVWTGGSVPDGEAAEFPFTVKLAQADGTEVPLPTIQRCPTTSNNWIEIAGESADDADTEDENSSPAPIIVVPAGGGGQASGDAPVSSDAPVTTATTVTTVQAAADASGDEAPTPITTTTANDVDNSAGGAGLIVLLIVMAVIVGGAVLLYVRNRKPTPDA